MILAGFVVDQRTEFSKWRDRPPTPAARRRAAVDAAVRASFDASGGTYGSPRVHALWSRPGGGAA